MKKIILFILISSIAFITTSAQTAVNFTVDDCDGNSTDLFSQLDSGKVVVMLWVMPCGACISVAANVNNVVQGYESSNPGKVLFYMVDDYGNSSCATLSSWASTNSIDVSACFSSSDIDMSDYGTEAMQKTVVLGGADHSVYFNDEGSISTSSMENAIDDALAAATSGINEKATSNFQLNVFPNPATDKLFVSYIHTQTGNIQLEIINMLGGKVKEITNENQQAGLNEITIDITGLKKGFYFLKISSDKADQLVKFAVLN